MKVRAVKLGYYDLKRRYEGDIFELLDEKDFSKRWMEKVSASTPVSVQSPANRAKRKLKADVVADDSAMVTTSDQEVI